VVPLHLGVVPFRDADHGSLPIPEPSLLSRRCGRSLRRQQETDMNTQNVEIDLLSDDALDAVAGGCEIDITIIRCPIGHLEVLTNPNNCPGVPAPQVVYTPK
jgi:hypothetical protein